MEACAWGYGSGQDERGQRRDEQIDLLHVPPSHSLIRTRSLYHAHPPHRLDVAGSCHAAKRRTAKAGRSAPPLAEVPLVRRALIVAADRVVRIAMMPMPARWWWGWGVTGQ